VAGNGAVLDRRGTLADRHGIRNLSQPVALEAGVPRPDERLNTICSGTRCTSSDVCAPYRLFDTDVCSGNSPALGDDLSLRILDEL
jgi:hypothetical protein